MTATPFLRRVLIRNYKSIASCDVQFSPLTFLVGPNGSGKSNFLDALRFVADALRTSLEHALRDRGGINDVRRRSGGHPNHFGLRLRFQLPDGTSGHYAFRIGARPHGAYQVQEEECAVQNSYFRVEDATVTKSTSPVAPPASRDRLYLVNAGGLPEFKPVYKALSSMGFYNLNPDLIRDLQSPDAGELLARDGRNITSVLSHLAKYTKERKTRIEEFLAAVVPGVQGVNVKVVGPKETLEFRQLVAGSGQPWRFPAANMSDGTLRALGVLVALFQSGSLSAASVPLVGIEEPEAALHPAAVGVLLDSLRDASQSTQVVVTSHSPDLLDDDKVATESILAVLSSGGTTYLAGIDEAGRSALRDHLYTAGELLRMGQLRPDPKEVSRMSKNQLRLFGEGGT